MRGSDNRSRELFSYVDLEQRVRQDHPSKRWRGGRQVRSVAPLRMKKCTVADNQRQTALRGPSRPGDAHSCDERDRSPDEQLKFIP